MLTEPKDYPEKTGLDERDANHPNFPKKIVRVFLKPLTQKIVEKDLWFEVIAFVMVFFTGCGELIGRRFSIEWYVILFLALSVAGFKTYKKLTAPIVPKEPPVPTVEEEEIKT